MSKKNLADQDMIEVNTEEAAEIIKLAFASRRPVMLWGSPGIGKSGLIQSICKDTNREMIDYRLLLKDLSDMKGILYYNPDSQQVETQYDPNIPDARRNPDANNILVFEELNAAMPTIQAATYQIILDRKCGDLVLPDGVDIVACGNLETDKGVTYNMPTPLRNRLLHLKVVVDNKAWENWAWRSRVHKDVIGFLSANKSKLYQFDPASGHKAFPTPRTWEFVSDLLISYEKSGISNRQLLRNTIGSAVGEGIAIEFMRYVEMTSKLPKVSDILAGKVKKAPKIDDISAHYSLAVGFVYEFEELSNKIEKGEIEKDHLNDELDHMFKFMNEVFSVEMSYMTIHRMLGQTSFLDYISLETEDRPEFKKFFDMFEEINGLQ